MFARKFRPQKGFTLIEIVVGISVLSIALLIMTGALFPQAQQSTNPWFQVRSAELAQSFMNEILGKRFDENSPLSAADELCDDPSGSVSCTDLTTDCSVTPWVEEGSRALFDDVDDYHCYTATGSALVNLEGGDLTDVYDSFTIQVSVLYAGTDIGLTDRQAKKVTVEVTAPNKEVIRYSSYRTNY